MTSSRTTNPLHGNARFVLFFLILIVCFVACFKLSYQVWVFFQDRLIVENQLKETISKVRVGFGHDSSFIVKLQNIGSRTEQWKPCNPDQATSDSSRVITVQGFTASGKRIGSNKEVSVNYSSGPLFGGEYLKIIIRPNGEIFTESN